MQLFKAIYKEAEQLYSHGLSAGNWNIFCFLCVPVSLFSPIYRSLQSLYSKKNMVYGALWRSWLKLNLSNSQLRSQLSTPTAHGKGWNGEDLSYIVEHICTCLLISKQKIWTGRRKGRGRVGEREKKCALLIFTCTLHKPQSKSVST